MSVTTRPTGPTSLDTPIGDNRERLVCDACGFILYENPKVVVGSVCGWNDRILLCRRAIEPQRGFWTIPAGYLELKETTEEGARREAREEARAQIVIETLLAVYNIPRISQVQMIYAASLESPTVSPGTESLETVLFSWNDIPWEEIAFPSNRWALRDYDEMRNSGATYTTRSNPPGEQGNL